jgi:hypothetical protein
MLMNSTIGLQPTSIHILDYLHAYNNNYQRICEVQYILNSIFFRTAMLQAFFIIEPSEPGLLWSLQ